MIRHKIVVGYFNWLRGSSCQKLVRIYLGNKVSKADEINVVNRIDEIDILLTDNLILKNPRNIYQID